jgi:hypothetical protein
MAVDDEDLITLCVECHAWATEVRRSLRTWLDQPRTAKPRPEPVVFTEPPSAPHGWWKAVPLCLFLGGLFFGVIYLYTRYPNGWH